MKIISDGFNLVRLVNAVAGPLGGLVTVPLGLATTAIDMYKGKDTMYRLENVENKLSDFSSKLTEILSSKPNLKISEKKTLELLDYASKSGYTDIYNLDRQFPGMANGLLSGKKENIDYLMDQQRTSEIVLLSDFFPDELFKVFQEPSFGSRIVLPGIDVFDRERINVSGVYNGEPMLYQLPRRSYEMTTKAFNAGNRNKNEELSLKNASLLVERIGESKVTVKTQPTTYYSPQLNQFTKLSGLDGFLWKVVPGLIEGLIIGIIAGVNANRSDDGEFFIVGLIGGGLGCIVINMLTREMGSYIDAKELSSGDYKVLSVFGVPLFPLLLPAFILTGIGRGIKKLF